MIWIWAIKHPNNRIGEYIKGSGTNKFVFKQGKGISKNVISLTIVFEYADKIFVRRTT